MNKILETLEEQKQARLNHGEKFLTEVKALMTSEAFQEREILNAIGLNAEIAHAEKITERQLLIRQHEETYEGKIFHINDIESIALKYRLYFRQARNYVGSIPADLGAILLRLKTKHNLNINNSWHSDSGKFYVLAPPKTFNDYEKLSSKKITIPKADPFLFYKVDEEHYHLLKVWGSDFTVGRRILGVITKTGFRVGLTRWLCVLALLGIIMFVPYINRPFTIAMTILFVLIAFCWVVYCCLNEMDGGTMDFDRNNYSTTQHWKK